jgi:rubrerythrin
MAEEDVLDFPRPPISRTCANCGVVYESGFEDSYDDAEIGFVWNREDDEGCPSCGADIPAVGYSGRLED